MTKNKQYNLSFSAGALLGDAFDAIINNTNDFNLLIKGKEKIDYTVIPVNAESSQKRYLSEVINRIVLVPVAVLDYYLINNINSRKQIQFLAVCLRYPIIAEFMIEVVREKWLNLDFELELYDFEVFLQNKLAENNNDTQITDMTQYKLSQVCFKMLNELGVYQKNKFTKIETDTVLMKIIYDTGNEWFLDVMLLNDIEKKEIISRYAY